MKLTFNNMGSRYKRMFLSAGISLLAKVATVGFFFISSPIILERVGIELFGVWLFINTFSLIMAFSDFGIGNGLVNKLGTVIAEKNDKKTVILVSSCFFMIASFSALIFGLISYYIYNTDICQLVGSNSCSSGDDIKNGFMIFILLLFVSSFGAIAQKVHIAQQSHYRNSLILIVGNVLSIIAFLLPHIPKETLVWIIMLASGPTAILTAVNAISFFIFEQKHLRPSFSSFDISTTVELLQEGAIFFLLSILAFFLFSGDSFFVGLIFGATQLAIFGAIARLTNGFLVFQHIAVPNWAAFNDALAQGDKKWARHAFQKMLIISFSTSMVSALILLIFGQEFITLWLGSRLLPDQSLLIAFACWLVLANLGSILGSIMNSKVFLRRQFNFYFVTVAVAGVGKMMAAHYEILSLITYSTVVAYSFLYLLPSFMIITKELKE